MDSGGGSMAPRGLVPTNDVYGGTNVGINTINGNNMNSNSTLFIFQDPTPSLLLAGLLGGCAVTASIVFLTFFICLRRKLVPSSSSDSSYSSACPGPNTDPNSLNSSPACLLRQSQPDSKWITLPGSHSGSSSTKDNFCANSLLDPLQTQLHHHHQSPQHPHQLQQHAHILRSSSPLSRSWSRNSYVTIASFWNDIFSTGIAGGQQQQHQQQSNNCPNNNTRASKVSNSTFIPGNRTSTNSNNTSTTTTKGSDVSPYAYAHILGIPPPPPPMISLAGGTKMGSIAAMSQNQLTPQPSPLTVSSQQRQHPHLVDWYSQASPSCTNLPGGGHIYSNHLYTFNPSPNNSPFLSQQLSSPKHSIMSLMNPLPPPPPKPPSASPVVPPTPPPTTTSVANSATTAIAPVGPDCATSVDGNSSTAGRSGSESLIQIDGWQCRKNFTKETDVVERFL